MTAYFIRRLMLVPLTFVAITFLVYAIVRIVPGGPVEQAEMRHKLAAMAGEAGGGASKGSAKQELDEDAIRELQRYYSLDEPIPIGYLQWLGAWPRPVRTRVPESTLNAHKDQFQPLLDLYAAQQKLKGQLDDLLSDKNLVDYRDKVYRPFSDEENKAAEAQDPKFFEKAHAMASTGFTERQALLDMLATKGLTYGGQANWYTPLEDTKENHELIQKAHEISNALETAAVEQDKVLHEQDYEVDDGYVYQVRQRWSGVLQLDLGESYTFNEPVLQLVKERLPISATIGLTGYILTWIVCVPLGILKAIRHRTPLDTATSFIVFLGYSMPGFVLCMVLLRILAADWHLLPLGGWPTTAPLGERIRYMIIPMAGYTVGSFATMTILMKNSLMENLSADYVRTALAKGLDEQRVIWAHAVRNSLIPLTAGIGSAVAVLFAGSFLIEKVCNIDGLGWLGYNALLQRDYPIVLGTLVIGVVIQLLGGILSDLIWASIDPRIRFEVKS